MFRWDIGVAMLVTHDVDGFPVVQPDVFGEEKSGIDPIELHHAFGFYGMPHEPALDAEGKLNPEKASQLLYAWEGFQGHAWPLEDTRMVTKLPRLKLGGSVQYGGRRARPAFSMLDGTTGSYQLYVPYAFSGDGDDATPSKASTIGINVRNEGQETVEIVHGSGMSITMVAGGKNSVLIKNKSGNAFVEVNDDGVVVNGNSKVVGSLTVGTPDASSVALAEPLVAYLTSLEAVLTTIAGATIPTTAAAVAAFQTATAALKAQIVSHHTKSS